MTTKKNTFHNPLATGKILLAVSTTESQKEIWTTTKINSDASKAYIESLRLNLSGHLDLSILQKAYNIVLSRHDSLHGTFTKNGKYFLVKEAFEQEINILDFSSETDKQLSKFLFNETNLDFDLVNGPLTRASLIKIDKNHFVFVFSAHHIICDGWSIAVVLSELSSIYNSIIKNEKHSLEWPSQFYEYATTNNKESVDHKNYWVKKFSSEIPVLKIPLSFKRPDFRTYESHRFDLEVNPSLVRKLKSLGAINGCSFYATLMTGFNIFLSKLSKSNTVNYGISAAAQSVGGHESLVGHLVSLLPMLETVDGTKTIKETLISTKNSLFDAFEHQNFTFGSLLKNIDIPRDPSRIPIVNIIFNVDQQYPGQGMNFEGLNSNYTTVPRHFENFELFFNMVTCGDDLLIECQFNTNLFTQDLISKWLDAYVSVLSVMIVNTDMPINSLLLDSNCFTEIIDNVKTNEIVKDKSNKASDLDENLISILSNIWEEALGFDGIPGDISFFSIGGHSILGLDIIAQIETKLDKIISLKDFFENPTINELAALLNSNSNQKNIFDKNSQVDTSFSTHPVTVKQMGVLYLEQLYDNTTMHNLPSAFHIHQKLDLKIFGKTIKTIVKNHPSLRSRFVSEGNSFIQVIDEIESLDFEYQAIEIKDLELQDNLQKLTTSNFDLENGPLFKIKVFKLAKDHFVIFFMVHHIVWDGWCFDIFFDELDKVYSALLKGTCVEIPSEEVSYAEYALWQKDFLASEQAKNEIKYWENKLSLPLPVLEFPIDKNRPVNTTHIGKSLDFSLDKNQTNILKTIAREQNVSFFNILLTCFKLTLAKYSADDEIIIGTPVRSRPTIKLNNTIGYFVNIVAIRSQINQSITLKELIQSVTHNTNEAISNDKVPFEIISNVLKLERDTSRTPVFQSFFSFQDISNRTNEFNGEKKQRVILDKASVHTDIDVSVRAAKDLTEFLIEYRTDLFEEITIKRLQESFCYILNHLEDFLDTKIESINIIPENQLKTLLEDWNDNDAGNDNRSFIKIIEDTAKKYPDSIAVIDNNIKLTYNELDTQSNSWANELISLGVMPGDNVGLSTDRNAHMLVSLLAILKTGAGYIPLEPNFPQDRLDYMIESSGLDTMLVQDHLANRFKGDVNKISIETLQNSKDLDSSSINREISLDSTCYIIYTSGSTGLPKGVELLHGSVTNFLQSMVKVPGIKSKDSLLAVTTLSFDIAVLELYAPLLVGGSVFIASKEQTIDGDELKGIIQKYNINIMQATPSTWRLLLASEWNGGDEFKILCGGEPFPKDLALKLCPIAKEVWNMYGPTETTVWSTVHNVKISDIKMYIGRPIDNTGIYILDEKLMPVPIGTTGEMYISGKGLAKGYKGREDLTKAVFINSPFVKNSRIYNTGDLARYHSDGKLECLGRNDGQVKVRGYRIELGEIESVISKFDNILEAVVVTREDVPGDVRIVAYLRINCEKLDQIGIRQYIGNLLPVYMIPSHFVVLDTFPKTLNEKIDKKKLKSDAYRPGKIPVVKKTINHSEITSPNLQSIEEVDIIIDNHIAIEVNKKTQSLNLKDELRNIWKEILNVEFIDDDVDFYSLGGHSISMLRIISKIKSDLKIKLNLKDFLSNNTINLLCDFLKSEGEKIITPKNIFNLKDDHDIPANDNQSKIYYFSQYYGDSNLYNLPSAIKCFENIDLETLDKSFNLLIGRHEALRTNFFEKDNDVYQNIKSVEQVEFITEEIKTTKTDMFKQIDMLKAKQFNFQTDLLFLFKLFKIENNISVIFFMPHHIIWDGLSFEIFFKELNEVYTSLLNNNMPNLPKIEKSYVEFILEQNAYSTSAQAMEDLKYWKNRFRIVPKPIEFPHVSKRNEIMQNVGKRLDFSLDAVLVDKLRVLAKENNLTVFTLLFGAYNIFLSNYLNRDDIVIGIPVSGRSDHKLDNTIGYFVNSLPVYSIIDHSLSKLENIKKVYSSFIDAFGNQRTSFDTIVKNLDIQRDHSRTPLYQVFFTYKESSNSIYTFCGKDIEFCNIDRSSTHTDLDITIINNKNGIRGYFDYRIDLFSSDRVELFLAKWQDFLTNLVKESNGKNLDKINKKERSSSGFENKVIDIWTELLGIEDLDSSSNFFLLGGHSILALKMFSKIQSEFNIKISFKEFFSTPTILTVCGIIEKKTKAGKQLKNNVISKNLSDESSSPVEAAIKPKFSDYSSFNQKSMHFSELLSIDSSMNNLPIAIKVFSEVDHGILEASINVLIDRHESLRTSFEIVHDKLKYTVLSKGEVKLVPEYLNITEDSIVDCVKEASSKRFDLQVAPLLDCKLFKINDSFNVVFLMFHHIIWDGTSFDLFTGELSEVYTALKNNKIPALKNITRDFSDFINLEKKYLDSEQYKEDSKFWKEHLNGELPILELPSDKIRPSEMEYTGELAQFIIHEDLKNKLENYSRQKNISLFNLFLAVFKITLASFSNTKDIIVGIPVNGRPSSDYDFTTGYFVNTIPIRSSIDLNTSFSKNLNHIRDNLYDCLEHQSLPFEKIFRQSTIERDLSRTPLFQTLFSYIDHQGSSSSFIESGSEYVLINRKTTHTDLDLWINKYNKRVTGNIQFYDKAYSKKTIQIIIEYFISTLESIVNEPLDNLLDIMPISHKKMLKSWSSNPLEVENTPVIRLIERQFYIHPHLTCLVACDQTLTYGQLDKLSNKWANRLIDSGVSPGDLVGLCTDRNSNLLIGLIAILKTGAGYVPLDPDFPKERLLYSIKESSLDVVVSEDSFVDLHPGNKKVISVGELNKSSDDTNPFKKPSLNDLLYILFTSGSTGEPKGVEVTNKSVSNLLQSMSIKPGVNINSKFLAVTTLSFDVSVCDLFLPLINGATIYLATKEQSMDGFELNKLIDLYNINTMQGTPSSFRLLLESGFKGKENFKVFCAGEAFPKDLAQKLLPICAEVWNLYGPTEATVYTTLHKISARDSRILIGKPLHNVETYVLDSHLMPVPIGAQGQLYIAGECLAKGYRNRDDLTSQVFVKNPNFNNKLMYNSGDIVRFNSEGDIEYIGRGDGQVKLRGHRIELGEIEARLASHTVVDEAVVVLKEDDPGDKRLVAYVKSQKVIEEKVLRAYLKDSLPAYMIPSHFITVDNFEKTGSGKINKKCLPPITNNISVDVNNDVKLNAVEKELMVIWQELLKTNNITLDDNFFDIGGHSLLAVILFSRIDSLYKVNIKLASLFVYPTIKELAQFIQSELGDSVVEFDEAQTTRGVNLNSPIFQCLVPMRPSGNGVPIFMFHSVGGNVLNYARLVGGFDSSHPVYGFQSKGVDGFTKMDNSIEQMAMSYINELKLVQPHGPYILCGGSMGGSIAIEVAIQLKKRGDKILKLIMLDTFGPNINIKKLKEEDSKKVKTIRTLKNLKESISYRLIKVINRMKTIFFKSFGIPIPHHLRYFNVEMNNYKAIWSYKPRHYAGDLVLFRAPIDSSGWYSDPLLGWKDTIGGHIKIIHLVGDHNNFVEIENLPQLINKELSN